MSEACKEAKFLKSLVHEITAQVLCIKLYNDIQSAILWSKEQIPYRRTKHIDVRNHFVREATQSKMVELHVISTNEMISDVLIRPVTASKHAKFIEALRLFKPQT